jgi:hypothetical protein
MYDLPSCGACLAARESFVAPHPYSIRSFRRGLRARLRRDLRCRRRTGASNESLRIDGSGSPLAEVANLGLVRPPVVYLCAITLGLVAHVLWWRQIVPHSLGAPVGALLTLAAVALFIYAVGTFRAAGTSIPNRPTATILRAGPYRFRRNPIYLNFSLFQLGLALWVNSLSLLLTLIPVLASCRLWLSPGKNVTSKRGFLLSTSPTRPRYGAGYRRSHKLSEC